MSGGAEGKHEPLIDFRPGQRAQVRLSATAELEGNGRGRKPVAHLLGLGMLKCECGASMRPYTNARSGTRWYRCYRKLQDGAPACVIPSLPQDNVDTALLGYLSEHVISAGLTAHELDAEKHRGEADARKAKSEAERTIAQADSRREAAELKWLDGKINDERWAELSDRFDSEREKAEADLRRAEATLSALAEPDDEAIAAVERLRADIAATVKDGGSLQLWHALLVKLYEHVEVVRAAEGLTEADLSASDDLSPMPTFTDADGRLYGLVPARASRAVRHRSWWVGKYNDRPICSAS